MDSLHNRIVALADLHGRTRESLLPILQGVVEYENYLSQRSMVEISRELDLPAAEVFGTATFYSFLEHRKMGKFTIRVCKNHLLFDDGKKSNSTGHQGHAENRYRPDHPGWQVQSGGNQLSGLVSQGPCHGDQPRGVHRTDSRKGSGNFERLSQERAVTRLPPSKIQNRKLISIADMPGRIQRCFIAEILKSSGDDGATSSFKTG